MEKAATATQSAMTPGQPPQPPTPGGQSHISTVPGAPQASAQASSGGPKQMHQGGFTPRGGDIGADVSAGVPMDKLAAMHGPEAVNRYFADRNLPVPG